MKEKVYGKVFTSGEGKGRCNAGRRDEIRSWKGRKDGEYVMQNRGKKK